jgi:protein TonB
MSRALALSFLLHIVILCGGGLAYWFSLQAPVVGPRAIDVTLVELSALETKLPPPQLPHHEPKAQAVIPLPIQSAVRSTQPKREEKRSEEIEPVKVKQQSNQSPPATDVVNPPVAAVSSSVGGGQELTHKARVSYHHMVATLLAKAKRYPERAVRGRVVGSGTLRLTVSPSGDVERVEVIKSTESNILDEELLRMVDRAAPFPAFPSEMNQADLTMLVPVSFRLEN